MEDVVDLLHVGDFDKICDGERLAWELIVMDPES